jgi:hypothetical protein
VAGGGSLLSLAFERKEEMDTFLQWVQSLDWERWSGPALAGLRIVLIVVVAWVSIVLLQKLVRSVRMRVADRLGGVDAARRAETLVGGAAGVSAAPERRFRSAGHRDSLPAHDALRGRQQGRRGSGIPLADGGMGTRTSRIAGGRRLTHELSDSPSDGLGSLNVPRASLPRVSIRRRR